MIPLHKDIKCSFVRSMQDFLEICRERGTIPAKKTLYHFWNFY